MKESKVDHKYLAFLRRLQQGIKPSKSERDKYQYGSGLPTIARKNSVTSKKTGRTYRKRKGEKLPRLPRHPLGDIDLVLDPTNLFSLDSELLREANSGRDDEIMRKLEARLDKAINDFRETGSPVKGKLIKNLEQKILEVAQRQRELFGE
jgi:hypothetical protein